MVPYFRLTNNCSKLDQRYRFDTKPNFPPEDEENAKYRHGRKKPLFPRYEDIFLCVSGSTYTFPYTGRSPFEQRRNANFPVRENAIGRKERKYTWCLKEFTTNFCQYIH